MNKFLIMANGDYGDPAWYRKRRHDYDRIICADGGACQAVSLGIRPDWVIGDMDSISQSGRELLERAGAAMIVLPTAKDFTDTHHALELAVSEGAGTISIWGGTGSRLDHTLANLRSAGLLASQGLEVRFESPAMTIYLVRDCLELHGREGDTVSVLALGDRATGVTLRGFEYPLDDVVLEGNRPCGISNVITGVISRVRVASGLLAVFHHLAPV